MPAFKITNVGDSRLQVRSDAGLSPLMPGMSGEYNMAVSLARYYQGAGAQVEPDPDTVEVGAEQAPPAKPDVAAMSPEDRAKLAEEEGIALGDTDPGSDDAVRLIAEFRRLYDSGTDKQLREQFGGEVDFTGVNTKRDAVNAIIAKRGVPA